MIPSPTCVLCRNYAWSDSMKLVGFGAATHHPSCRRLPVNAERDREFLVRHGLGNSAFRVGVGGTTPPPVGMSAGAKVAIVAVVAVVALAYYGMLKPKKPKRSHKTKKKVEIPSGEKAHKREKRRRKRR
jgi:hypothetical protein